MELDHTTKWYMHKLESDLENETHKFLRDFEIQMDHLILARKTRPNVYKEKKRTCHLVDFTNPVDYILEIKQKEWHILGSCQRSKKFVKHNGEGLYQLKTWKWDQKNW